MPFVLILIKVIYRRLKNMFKKFLLVLAALSIVGCTLSEVDISKKQKRSGIALRFQKKLLIESVHSHSM